MKDFGDRGSAGLDTDKLGISRGPVAGAALGMVLLAFGAAWLAASEPAAALAIRAFFSGLCHQDPARSFAIHGVPLAVCARCLGIYGGVAAGAALGGWLRWRNHVALRCFLAGLLLNGADAAAEALHLHGNLPLERLLLGALLGVAAGILLTLPIARASERISPRRDDAAASRTG